MVTSIESIPVNEPTRLTGLSDDEVYAIQNIGTNRIKIRTTDDTNALVGAERNGWVLQPFEFGRVRQNAGGSVFVWGIGGPSEVAFEPVLDA